MEKEADVVIIGGGISGLAVAYNLAKGGLKKVIVLEKGYLGSGATTRCLCGIRASFTTPETIVLMKECIKLWKNLNQELGYNTLFHQNGYLFLALSEDEIEAYQKWINLHKSFGLKSQFLSPSEVKMKIPQIDANKIFGGLFNPEDGSAHHDAVVRAYARAALKMGVKIYTYTKAIKLTQGDGRVKSVITDRGEIYTSIVVNAASAHAAEIAKTVGVNLPITVIRRHALVTEPLKHFLDPILIMLSYGAAYHQSLRGEVLGTTRIDEPPTPNIKASLNFLESCAKNLVYILPPMKNVRVLRQWAGLYDVTPDGSPIIGSVEEVEGFIQINGGSGHGFMMAPLLGKLIAQLIIDGVESSLIKPFNIKRFKEGKLIVEKAVTGKKIG
ncbi:MAG: FAD-binding oxidoreductase [Nitrososphaerales archaeon]